ncbi:phosphotransferase family protein [Thioalkalivibrio sp. ALE11]|uniref:phosphotransferase family protein n=1 Tax=Thioalkalivibrio sp. ALE11 TaxID=1265494 RepID=UPI0012DDE42D|nr:phosphotransferase [Thioalkalivibrio sp. ALE11]
MKKLFSDIKGSLEVDNAIRASRSLVKQGYRDEAVVLISTVFDFKLPSLGLENIEAVAREFRRLGCYNLAGDCFFIIFNKCYTEGGFDFLGSKVSIDNVDFFAGGDENLGFYLNSKKGVIRKFGSSKSTIRKEIGFYEKVKDLGLSLPYIPAFFGTGSAGDYISYLDLEFLSNASETSVFEEGVAGKISSFYSRVEEERIRINLTSSPPEKIDIFGFRGMFYSFRVGSIGLIKSFVEMACEFYGYDANSILSKPFLVDFFAMDSVDKFLAHGDLHNGNLIKSDESFKIIDWGRAQDAPIGLDFAFYISVHAKNPSDLECCVRLFLGFDVFRDDPASLKKSFFYLACIGAVSRLARKNKDSFAKMVGVVDQVFYAVDKGKV